MPTAADCTTLLSQVMEWTQTLLQAGEAFSGGPAADMRASLQVLRLYGFVYDHPSLQRMRPVLNYLQSKPLQCTHCCCFWYSVWQCFHSHAQAQ
jgi:hypothetical protein